MNSTPEPAFLWSDAWILLAIALVGRDSSASLTQVVAAADAVQHAIPAREEINGAVGRLVRAGYVVPEGARLGLTESGRALDAATSVGGKTHSARQTALEAALGAISWSAGIAPTRALRGEAALYSEPEYDVAIATYTGAYRAQAE